jgi:hypothetical protein
MNGWVNRERSRAVPAFELSMSQAIFHSKDSSEKNLT